MTLCVVSLGLALSLFGRPALRVLANPAYYPAANLIPLIVTAFIFQSWGGVVQFGIDAAERTKYVTLVIWVSAIIIAALYAVMIPRFGAYGAASATLIAFSARTVLLSYFAKKVWPLTYHWGRQFRILAVGAVLCAFAWLVPTDGFFSESVVAALLYTLFAVYVWRAELSEDLRSALRHRLSRFAAMPRRWLVPA